MSLCQRLHEYRHIFILWKEKKTDVAVQSIVLCADRRAVISHAERSIQRLSISHLYLKVRSLLMSFHRKRETPPRRFHNDTISFHLALRETVLITKKWQRCWGLYIFSGLTVPPSPGRSLLSYPSSSPSRMRVKMVMLSFNSASLGVPARSWERLEHKSK